MRTITRLTLALALLLAVPVLSLSKGPAWGEDWLIRGPHPIRGCSLCKPGDVQCEAFWCEQKDLFVGLPAPAWLKNQEGPIRLSEGDPHRIAPAGPGGDIHLADGERCSPAHLLSLLQQQAEFVIDPDPKQTIMLVPAVNYPLPTAEEILRKKAKDLETQADKLKRQKQVTAEVQQTLKECK